MLAHFPPPLARDPTADALTAIDAALLAIDLGVDKTKGTREYVDELRTARRELGDNTFTWRTWRQLYFETPTKKSLAHAAPVQAAALYDRHPGFQQDLRAMIEQLFVIAGEAMARFAALKAERGLIDFTDMEQLTLHALDNEFVKARLEEELDLLLVDEFQDTSPIQLAVFMRLARLAKRAVFVGDVKQAVYGFRGTDPGLVFATLDGLEARGAVVDVLEHSWRSRPSLVAYLNDVFVRAFAGEVPPEQVRLDAQRAELIDAPPVERWTLVKSRAEYVANLARAVETFVRSGAPVVDPEDGTARPVRYGDIAILARTNDHVQETALALSDHRVPMKMTISGLLAMPETQLAKACLRRIVDPNDTLATAEILTLADCESPEAWLPERLAWLESEGVSSAWREADHPWLSMLAAMREEAAILSPVEITARVLNMLPLREVVSGWGPDTIKAEQRQRNLDAFLNLAVEYEKHAASQGEAATLAGFVLWLRAPMWPEYDLQPVITGGDAVHVLTYHKAKGLEWPAVIACDLEGELKLDCWGIAFERGDGPLDIDDPLAGRRLRWWPDPFGTKVKDVDVIARIAASDEGRAMRAREMSEARRLLYVGFTRARDRLIYALTEGLGGGDWLSLLNSPDAVPSGDALTLGDGTVIRTRVADMQTVTPTPRELHYAPTWFRERECVEHLIESRPPSGEAPVAEAQIGRRVELGNRLALAGAPDMTAIGDVLHAIVAAVLINPDAPDHVERAEEILAVADCAAHIDADAAVDMGRSFHRALIKTFAPRHIYAEYPVLHIMDNGQIVRGWIDALLDTEAGWVIVDHKSSPRPRSEWEAEALAYSGQLDAYRRGVRAATDRAVVGTWIHFTVGAGLVEVVFSQGV